MSLQKEPYHLGSVLGPLIFGNSRVEEAVYVEYISTYMHMDYHITYSIKCYIDTIPIILLHNIHIHKHIFLYIYLLSMIL